VNAARRQLLHFLAASPLLSRPALAQGSTRKPDEPPTATARKLDRLIENARQALDIPFDQGPDSHGNSPNLILTTTRRT
jgi:hypothetical protein